MIALQVFAVGTRTHIETVDPGIAHQLHQVLVALIVLCKHYEMVAAHVALVALESLLTVARHIHLTAEDGLERGLALVLELAVDGLAVVEELLDAEHIAVVGDGHAAHTVGHSLVYEPLHGRLSVENGVICVNVEVDEIFHYLWFCVLGN